MRNCLGNKHTQKTSKYTKKHSDEQLNGYTAHKNCLSRAHVIPRSAEILGTKLKVRWQDMDHTYIQVKEQFCK